MKKEYTAETEAAVGLAVGEDDPEAGDVLEQIERGNGTSAEKDEAPEEKVKGRAATADRASAGPFELESIYFRSFGERPLLNREQEVVLAKRIDRADHAIRAAFREVAALAARMRKTDNLRGAMYELHQVRGLSGLSAMAMERALARFVHTQARLGRSIARDHRFNRHGLHHQALALHQECEALTVGNQIGRAHV